MVKNWIEKELEFKGEITPGSVGVHVMRMQELLHIQHLRAPHRFEAVKADKDFGPKTKRALLSYQRNNHLLEETGVLDETTYALLASPIANMLQTAPNLNPKDIRANVVWIQRNLLLWHPVEIQPNKGPFVRCFMDGWDGESALWCVGVVQFIDDLAYSRAGQKFTDHFTKTYHCDTVGKEAIQKGWLMPYTEYDPSRVQAGDDGQIVKTAGKHWRHILKVNHVDGDWIQTVEGNTNAGGSANGWEWCMRWRNVKREKIDIILKPY